MKVPDKFCIHCRHHEFDAFNGSDYVDHNCTVWLDPVTSERMKWPCAWMRDKDGKCGVAGDLYEVAG